MSGAQTAIPGIGCEHPAPHAYGRVVFSNGVEHVARYCPSCDEILGNGARYVARDALELRTYLDTIGVTTISALPIILNHDQPTPCTRCGAPYSERHHTFPREMRGTAEANRWPIVDLCDTCHDIWHDEIKALGWRKVAEALLREWRSTDDPAYLAAFNAVSALALKRFRISTDALRALGEGT